MNCWRSKKLLGLVAVIITACGLISTNPKFPKADFWSQNAYADDTSTASTVYPTLASLEVITGTTTTTDTSGNKITSNTYATLSPSFDGQVTTYNINLNADEQQVKIAAVATDSTSTVTLKDENFTVAATVNEGDQAETSVTVTAANGQTTIYNLIFHRTPSASTELDDILINNKSLSEYNLTDASGNSIADFNSSITDYYFTTYMKELSIQYDEKYVSQYVDGDLDTQALNIGENTKHISVTSEDGLNTKTYTLHITRTENTYLSSLSISNYNVQLSKADNTYGFEPKTLKYFVIIPNNYVDIFFNYQTMSDGATVNVSGNQYLMETNGTIKITVSKDGLTPTTYTISYMKAGDEKGYSYLGKYYKYTAQSNNFYTLQAWGAQGGSMTSSWTGVGGKGGYAKGTIWLNAGESVYIYVGQQGAGYNPSYSSFAGGWNGGGNCYGGASAGGGATDFRYFGKKADGTEYVPTEAELAWNSSLGLASRIMVAGAGGGSNDSQDGGVGGGLIGTTGVNGSSSNGAGGSQLAGGAGWISGSFGIGGGSINSNSDGGAGGGGYFGGAKANGASVAGGGGSGYISGFTGAVAIKSATDISPRLDSNGVVCTATSAIADSKCSEHYSGKVMTDTILSDGATTIPTHDNTSTQKGNSGHGYAWITTRNKNNYLKDLSTSNGIITRANTSSIDTDGDGDTNDFDPLVNDYVLTLSAYDYYTNITATASSPEDETIVGTGRFSYEAGSETNQTIVATSEDGETRTYNLKIVRPVTDNNTTRLSSLSVNETELTDTFTPNTLAYIAKPFSDRYLDLHISAVAFNPNATIKISGDKYLANLEGDVTITVSSEGLDDSVYTIHYTRTKDTTNEYSYTGNYQTFTAPENGMYFFEGWGARGGEPTNKQYTGGKGAYTSGYLTLNKDEKIYIYVGQTSNTVATKNWNGGGTGGSSTGFAGGGATDFRLTAGDWNNSNSLSSRIMVAGAGGGAVANSTLSYDGNGADAGALVGYDATMNYTPYAGHPVTPPTGATQISGGVGYINQTTQYNTSGYSGSNGQFGYGGNSASLLGGGGGSGYFGGGGGGWTDNVVTTGGSGSSFISGYLGAIAVASNSVNTPRLDASGSVCTASSAATDITCSKHYSGKVFVNPIMKSGKEIQPTTDDASTQTGNDGNGFARIVSATNDTYLRDITVSSGTLKQIVDSTKGFDALVNSYQLELDSLIESVDINGIPHAASSIVSGNGTISLDYGETKTVNLLVTDGLNTSSKTYVVTVMRKAAEHNTKLKNLSVENVEFAFDKDTTSYNIKLPKGATSASVNATTFDADATVLISGNNDILNKTGIITVTVSHVDENGTAITSTVYTLNYTKDDGVSEYNYDDNYQVFTAPSDGNYKFELWGAEGNDSLSDYSYGGNGGYTSGFLELTKGEKVYLYTGEHRRDTLASIGAGSTGTNGVGGGGATDIRYFGKDYTPTAAELKWDSALGLRSRIMVAGGGAGAVTGSGYRNYGGVGGNLVGGSGSNIIYSGSTEGVKHTAPTGGTQTNGGTRTTCPSNVTCSYGGAELGSFGIGGSGNSGWGSGAGGGYWGGTAGSHSSASVDAGAGGSSFISGYIGSVAVASSTTNDPRTSESGTVCTDGTTDISCSYHYSGKIFTNTIMKSGAETMPSWDGTSTMTGNIGYGHIKITTPSNDNYLSDLSSDKGTLARTDTNNKTNTDGDADETDFDPMVLEYNLTIGALDSEYTLNAVAHDETSVVTGTGTFKINNGETQDKTVSVTGNDSSVRNYIIHVSRPNYTEHTTLLKTLTVDAVDLDFRPENLNYTIHILKGLSAININYEKYDADATVTTNIPTHFVNDEGDATITISHDGLDSTIYTIHYIRDLKETSTYSYTGNYKKFTASKSGYYTIELWGAAGGDGKYNGNSGSELGGRGAYTKGDIYLEAGEAIYLYDGQKGISATAANEHSYIDGGWNGGGKGTSGGTDDQAGSGGGATDVRYFGKNSDGTNYEPTSEELAVNSTLGLNSRIMVAAGGGGGHSYTNTAFDLLANSVGSNGGGLSTIGNIYQWQNTIYTPKETSQTTGNSFGLGGAYASLEGVHGAGGGGGGYFGGFANLDNQGGSGQGGSSYISGHTGAVAIKSATDASAKDGCTTGTTDNNCSIHYSNKTFKNTEMIDGRGYSWGNVASDIQSSMPNPISNTFEIGNSDNGFSRITFNALESDATLKSLVATKGTLAPEFNENKTEYTLNLDSSIPSTEISAEAYSNAAKISGTGTVKVEPGETKTINIIVTAENGTTKTYKVNVVRATISGHSTKLKSLQIEKYESFGNKIFQSDKTTYDITIGSNTYDLSFTADPFDSDVKSSNIVITGNDYLSDSGVITITVGHPVTDADGNNVSVDNTVYTINYTRVTATTTSYDYTGDYQTFIAPYTGNFRIETWGAQGGSGANKSTTFAGGLGAYTSGEIHLNKDDTLYIYVGGQGTSHSYVSGEYAVGGWNGGGAGGDDVATGSTSISGGAGGGATDISLVAEKTAVKDNRSIRSVESYASRIMVAAGGGGGSYVTASGTGRAGAGLSVVGQNIYNGAVAKVVSLGNQTSGFAFGYGANGSLTTNTRLGGGGAGYWTAEGDNDKTLDTGAMEGAGGTSYISGHTGSVAVSASTSTPRTSSSGSNCVTGTSDIVCSEHESGYIFTNTKMIDGNGYAWTNAKATTVSSQPTHDGTSTQTGNAGNGYAKITAIAPSENNYLTNVIVNSGDVKPAYLPSFNPIVSEYNLAINQYDEYVNVNGILSDKNAKIAGEGKYYVELGKSKDVTLTVTSVSGDIRNYIIHISRPEYTDAHSSKLKTMAIQGTFGNNLNREFISDGYTYTLYMPSNEIDLNINYTTFDADATVKITGNKHITTMTGDVTITVSAPNVDDTIYTIHYIKLDSNYLYKDDVKLFNYTGSVQTFVAPYTANYYLQAWGAMGGWRSTKGNAGAGGYAEGHIQLNKGDILYIYAGGDGTRGAGWNGGGYSTWSGSVYGGGASDVRIDGQSLYNRILVAGGGGSVGADSRYGMWAGGEAGGTTGQSYGSGGEGASLSAAGGYRGTFGVGGNGATWSGGYAGAGGGGWYGGGGSNPDGSGDDDRGGGGGSGFAWSDTYAKYAPTGYLVSASRKMTNVKLINGATSMPTMDNKSTMVGNRDHGAVSIISASKPAYNYNSDEIDYGVVGITIDDTTLNKDDYLVDLKSDVGTLSRADNGDTTFDPAVQEYNLALNKYSIDYKLTGTLSDTEKATVVGLNEVRTIEAGETKDVAIVVTSEAGTTRTYTIHVSRLAVDSTDKTTLLKSLAVTNAYLELSPRFNPYTKTYDISFASGEIDASIEYVKFDDAATVTIANDRYLIEDTGTITLTVKEDGVEDTIYTINYKKVGEIEGATVGYSYTGAYQTFVAPGTGRYKFQAWGARGGGSTPNSNEGSRGGAGGYTSGTRSLKKGETVYIYVGGAGWYGGGSSPYGGPTGGWNGGGYGGNSSSGSGGGATDFRYFGTGVVPTTDQLVWNSTNGLASRFIVAGAGGGSDNAGGSRGGDDDGSGGAGGGLTAEGAYINGALQTATAATQTTGLGLGQGGNVTAGTDTGGAGGGYYGGLVTNSFNGGGGGGSGYFGDANVTDGVSIVGTASMPTHDNKSTMTGNVDNGYARVTLVDSSRDNYLTNIVITDKSGNNLVYTPTFDILKNEYSITIDPSIDAIDIEGRTSSDKSKVEGTGLRNIPAGNTDQILKVTAESGDERIYTVHVHRDASSDDSIKDIKISGLTPTICARDTSTYCNLDPTVFNQNEHIYTMTVPSGIREIAFDVSTNHFYESVNDESQKYVHNYKVKLSAGDNDIVFKIVSEDGTKTNTYKYEINRDMTGDNYLDTLQVTDPQVDIGFSYLVTGYGFKVDNSVENLKLFARLDDPNASLSLDANGTPAVTSTATEISGEFNINVTGLAVGTNYVDITVKAANGELRTYTLTVYRAMSADTLLSALTFTGSNGVLYSLTPVFSNIVTSYTLTVPNEVTSVNVAATAEAPATTKVVGTGSHTLTTGINQITVTTTAENGSTENYVVMVTRLKNSNANLSSLSADECKFAESFDKDTVNYTCNVSAEIMSLTVSAKAAVETSSYAISGNDNFTAGNNNVIVKVTAEDGTVKNYTITVNRSGYTINSLLSLTVKDVAEKELALTPVFDPETNSYNIDVPNETSRVVISGEKPNARTTVAGLGSHSLATGPNTVNVVVTPEVGDARTYTLNIFRAYNTNSTLSAMVITDQNKKVYTLTPDFDATKTSYTLQVGTDVEKLNFSVTKGATISKVEGDGTHTINSGVNTIAIKVTAEDGTSTIYNIVVTKATSDNANLTKLAVRESVITPDFDQATTEYTTRIPSEFDHVTIDAVVADEKATYTVAGNTNLVDGNNAVTVTVTSESGVQKVYTINVIRQSNPVDKDGNPVDLTLSSLSTSICSSVGTGFSASTLYYECTVPYDSDKTDITATPTDADYVAHGSTLTGAGTNKGLVVGDNIFKVIMSNNNFERVYTIKIIRQKSDDARLKNIIVKNGTMTRFDSADTTDTDADGDTTDYDMNIYEYNVTTEDSSLDFNIEKLFEGQTVKISGNADFENGVIKDVTVDTISDFGVATKKYVFHVTKTKNQNNFLSSLTVKNGDNVLAYSPVFNRATDTYTITVPDEISDVIISYTTESALSIVTGDGAKQLNVGENVFPIYVTSENNVVKTYTLKITRIGSHDSSLAGLAVMNHDMTPQFNPTTLTYNVSVAYNVETVDIVANSNNEEATISGNGVHTTRRGTNTYPVVVTAGDGTTTTYNVVVERDNPVTSLLDNILVDNYQLDSTFNSHIYEYDVTVDYEIEKLSQLNIRPITIDEKATYEISPDQNDDTKNGLVVGSNKVTIRVTSSDGLQHTTYTLNIIRQAKSNTYLSSLTVIANNEVQTLSPVFDKSTMTYSVVVDNTIASATVNAVAENGSSKITGTGAKTLSVGSNKQTITVTSTSGTSRKYYVDIIRAGSANAFIKSLTSNVGTVSKTGTFTYSLTIPRTVTAITHDDFSVSMQDTGATYKLQDYLDLATGKNDFTITTKSQDGSVSYDYVVYVYYAEDNETRLLNLTADAGNLDPTFNKDTYNYDVHIRDDVNKITVTPTLINSKQKVTNLADLTNYSVTSYKTKVPVVVTAEDGETTTYYLNVIKDIATGKELVNLTDSYDTEDCHFGTCTNVQFVSGTYDYNISVVDEVYSISFTASTNNATQSVKFYKVVNGVQQELTNGTSVGSEFSGTFSGYGAALDNGDNVFKVIQTNKLNESTTYTITVNREVSSNTELKSLGLSRPAKQVESFDPNKLEYTLFVPNEYTSVDVAAEAYRPEVTTITSSGYNNLIIGDNDIKVKVTAHDGSKRTYVLHVIRMADVDNYLKSLTISSGVIYNLSPKFNPATSEYSVVASSDVSAVLVEATPDDSNCTVQVNGKDKDGMNQLAVGTNKITISVTATTGEIRTYIVNIYRSANANTYLSNLELKNGTMAESFNKDKESYTAVVDNDVTNLNIVATPEDPNAKVTIKGNTNLSVGTNMVYITVLSADLSHTRVYNIEVSRDGSSDARLTGIKLDDKSIIDYGATNGSGETMGVFNPDVKVYNVSLPYDKESVNIEAITEDSTATTTGAGLHSLNIGDNSIMITVTAGRGNTENYILHIYRRHSPYLKTIETTDDAFNTEFNSKVNNYNHTVPNETKSYFVYGTPEDSNASVTGSGTYNLHIGVTVVTLTVKSVDGEETTYTVTLNREASNNNYLKTLKTAQGTMDPEFVKTTNEYSINVLNTVKSLDLTYEPEDSEAKVEVIGNSLSTVANKTTDVKIRVTATSGAINEYVIHVTSRDSTYFSNLLKSLTVSTGTLFPAFDPTINNYSVSVTSGTSDITIKAVRESESSDMTGTGTFTLVDGDNVFPIVVTNKAGIQNIYKVTVNRSSNPDARLKSLSFNNGSLAPTFNKNTYKYNLSTSNDTTALIVNKLETIDSGAICRVTVDGVVSSCSETSKIMINSSTTSFTIRVTASDNSATKTYRLNLVRSKSSNSRLASLASNIGSLTPTFTPEVNAYQINVATNIESINLVGAPESSLSTVTGLGVVNLKKGSNIANIVVTAENGTTSTYTVIINRAYSTDAALIDLGVKNHTISPAFETDKTAYSVTVPYEEMDAIVVASANSHTSTITGTGTHALEVGDNTINVTVMAEDGETTKTYTLTITRAKQDSNKIANLWFNEGELNPVFTPLIDHYNMVIPYENTSITEHVTLESEGSAYVVSNNSDLKVGTNYVYIDVTNKAGETTRYTIVVNRSMYSDNFLSAFKVTDIDPASGNIYKTYEYSPTFNAETNYYELQVSNAIEKVFLSATAASADTVVTGLGEQTLTTGDNYLLVKSKSASGIERITKLHVVRAYATDSSLSSLSIANIDTGKVYDLSPIFNSDNNSYTAKVPNNIGKVRLSAVPANNAATVIWSVDTSEDHTNNDVALKTGDNIITVVVTSEAGVANTYRIKVTRAMDNNTNITNIIPSTGTMTPSNVFTGDSYMVAVEPGTNVISFNITPESTTTKISGSENLILSQDTETKSVTLTAEDGTIRTLTFAINRGVNVQSIAVDPITASVVTGETYQINASVVPDNVTNKALTYTSADASIATVDEKGIVTGVKSGSTTIAVASAASPEIKSEFTISVISNHIESNVYTIYHANTDKVDEKSPAENYTIGSEPKVELGTFLEDFLNDRGYLHVYDKDGNEISDTTTFASSFQTIKLIINGKVYDEMKILVRGDIDGDGFVSAVDVNKLKNMLSLKTIKTGSLMLQVVDVDYDTFASASDTNKMNKYVSKLITTVNPDK